MGLTMRENRKAVRVVPHFHRPILVELVGVGFIEQLRAHDISVGGVGIIVPHDFRDCDLEQEVQMVVKLPGEKAFVARAQIRHLSQGEQSFGVQFIALAPESLKLVQHYVAHRLAEGGPGVAAR